MESSFILKCALIVLAAVNIIAILVTMTDKAAAIAGNSRVPERTLFLLGALGGATCMYLTMLLIRHKTQHKSFMIGLPVMMLAQYIIAYMLYKYALPLLPV